MNISFSGKVALVTGGAMGNGYATAEGFAESGERVAIADINNEALEKAAQTLRNAGHDVLAFLCDTSKEDQIVDMISKTVSTFGRLHAVLNNAALQTPPGPSGRYEHRGF